MSRSKEPAIHSVLKAFATISFIGLGACVFVLFFALIGGTLKQHTYFIPWAIGCTLSGVFLYVISLALDYLFTISVAAQAWLKNQPQESNSVAPSPPAENLQTDTQGTASTPI